MGKPNEEDPARGSVASQLSYEDLRQTPNLGKRSLDEVIAWLAEEGLEPRGGMPRKAAISQSRINEAISLLERHGYTVVKP